MIFIVTTPKKQLDYEEYGENEDIFGFDVTPTSELEVNTEYTETTTAGLSEETTETERITEGSSEETTETETEASPELTTVESIIEGPEPGESFPSAAKVECTAKCEDEEYRPLCGDDGVTYSSLCHLQVTLVTLESPGDDVSSDGSLPQ